MLTNDLLKVKISDSVIAPVLVSQTSLQKERAEIILQLVKEHQGRPKGELLDAIKDIAALEVNHKLWKGLAKVMLDQCEFVAPVLEQCPDLTAMELRKKVFLKSSSYGLASLNSQFHRKSKDDILREIGDELGCEGHEIEAFLYADHKEMHLLEEIPKIQTATELIQRYNLVAYQSLLLYASSMRIKLFDIAPKWLRYIFRRLKFNRLMFQVWQHPTHIELLIDGPQSVLKQSSKYGLQFAMFLPVLPLLPGTWHLQAEILWGQKRKVRKQMMITSEQSLYSHYEARGVWKSNAEEWFEQRFLEKERGWVLAQGKMLNLGEQQVLIPDFAFKKSEDGQDIAYLDIIGFWRRNYLDQVIKKAPKNVIFAVSKKYAADAKNLPNTLQERIVFFSEVISVTSVLEKIEKIKP